MHSFRRAHHYKRLSSLNLAWETVDPRRMKRLGLGACCDFYAGLRDKSRGNCDSCMGKDIFSWTSQGFSPVDSIPILCSEPEAYVEFVGRCTFARQYVGMTMNRVVGGGKRDKLTLKWPSLVDPRSFTLAAFFRPAAKLTI
jgi:hypothetical protein